MGAILSILAILWIGYAFFSGNNWSYGNDSDLEFYVSRYLYPFHLALVMGYFYCVEPNGSWKYHKDSFLIGLGLSLAFMFIYQVIIKKRKHLFVRDAITEIAVILLGYGIALFTKFLSKFSILFFILLYPVHFIAGIMLAMLPISLVVWFIPNFILRAINTTSKRKEMQRSTNVDNNSNDDESSFNNVQSIPNIITDQYGQKYRLINMHVYSADYQGMQDSSIITIRNSDISPTGLSAKNSYGYFTW